MPETKEYRALKEPVLLRKGREGKLYYALGWVQGGRGAWLLRPLDPKEPLFEESDARIITRYERAGA